MQMELSETMYHGTACFFSLIMNEFLLHVKILKKGNKQLLHPTSKLVLKSKRQMYVIFLLIQTQKELKKR